MDQWMIVFAMYFAVAAASMMMASVIFRSLQPKYLVAAIAIVAIDFSLTLFAPVWINPYTRQFDLHWNWTGKGASVIFSFLLLLLSPRLRDASGLTIRQSAGSLDWSIGLSVAAALAAVIYAWYQPATSFNSETLLFQALMPTLSEELVYRGTLLAVLAMAWPQSQRVATLSINVPAVVITLIFALGHGVSWNNGLHVSTFSMLWTGIVGAMLMYIRLRSGSLLFPMVAHSLFNLVTVGVPMLH